MTDNPFMDRGSYRIYARFSLFILFFVILSGCGRFFGPEATEESPPAPPRTPLPTFTPTSTSAANLEPAPTDTPVPPEPILQGEPAAEESLSDAPEVEPPADESKPAKTLGSLLQSITPQPSSDAPESTEPASTDSPSDELFASTDPLAIVSSDLVNVRRGPGTTYDLLGSVSAGEQFAITGRNEAGDWWQVCCLEGTEPGWLYGPLVTIQNGENVAVAANIPPLPDPQPSDLQPSDPPPSDLPPTELPIAAGPTPVPVEESPASTEETAPPAALPAVAPAESGEHSDTAGNFDPNAQFHIVHYHVRGFHDNNGGIFNNGGQHMIFITVLDENGNGIDGAVVKDVLADSFSITTGSKGPGRTEFEMFWEPYKLTVASSPSGPVTSQVSNQMNTAKPHIPDIIGKMGPADNEYAICPTPDDRCEPPFYHAHWSYEITFQKVK